MHRVSKVLILATIALALANAQCFVRCSVGACTPAEAPCHQPEKSGNPHCASQPALSAEHFRISMDEMAPAWIVPCGSVPQVFGLFEPLAQEWQSPPAPGSLPPDLQLRI